MARRRALSLVGLLLAGLLMPTLLVEAQQAGCTTVDGLPMLVAQAERQFEWWTGQRPATGIMEAALRTRICN